MKFIFFGVERQVCLEKNRFGLIPLQEANFAHRIDPIPDDKMDELRSLTQAAMEQKGETISVHEAFRLGFWKDGLAVLGLEEDGSTSSPPTDEACESSSVLCQDYILLNIHK
jgi:hypothetical protein